MAHLNRRLRPETETLFLLASEEYAFVSSRMIKEVIMLGGDVAQFVPQPVLRHLRAKLPH
jgi:pantetheine-phosphate adenylyltransferase